MTPVEKEIVEKFTTKFLGASCMETVPSNIYNLVIDLINNLLKTSYIKIPELKG